jgi:hypothetical protein
VAHFRAADIEDNDQDADDLPWDQVKKFRVRRPFSQLSMYAALSDDLYAANQTDSRTCGAWRSHVYQPCSCRHADGSSPAQVELGSHVAVMSEDNNGYWIAEVAVRR